MDVIPELLFGGDSLGYERRISVRHQHKGERGRNNARSPSQIGKDLTVLVANPPSLVVFKRDISPVRMAPYLDTVKSFADVPITDAGVDTLAFLEASEGLLGLFDLLGSAAFAPVQSDIKGNIVKVRARYDAAPALSATLEELVNNEKGEKKRTATEGLMWLLRGLSFTCKALQNSQSNKAQELSVSFNSSYDATLKKFHGILIRPIFALAMKACPYRADFYAKLAVDKSGGPRASEEKLNEQLDKWLAALEAIVRRMEEFYAKGKHDKGF